MKNIVIKLLICLILVSMVLISCDSKIKRCSYDIYQQGKKLPTVYTKYVKVPEWCESYSKDGVVYKLISTDIIYVKDISFK